MHPYSYSKLNGASQEIRILTLLPGELEEPVWMTITHESLRVDNLERPPRTFTKAEQDSLPYGWKVLRTMSGRIIYDYTDPSGDYKGIGITSWTHPGSETHQWEIEDIYESPADIAPSYEALSYVWGSSKEFEIAFIAELDETGKGSKSTFTTMKVGQNLMVALKQLRNVYAPRRLWVDAVCINQTDFEEREEQVLRMDAIYSAANRVLIWLGPSLHDSHLAISTLRSFGSRIDITWDRFMVASPDYCEKLSWPPELPSDEMAWLAINKLFELPWFERLWILQESQRGNSKSIVICGVDEISWDLFRRAVVYIYAFHGYSTIKLSQPLRQCLEKVHRLCWSMTHGSFPYLLSVSRNCKCALPVDKIYGILGLAPPRVRERIKPNYRLSAGELYKTVFLNYSNLVHRLELLGFSNLQHRLEHMPSWLPNWSLTFPVFIMWWMGGFLASGVSAADIHYGPSSNILEVTGVKCATIRTVSKSTMERMSDLYDLVREVGPERLQAELYVTGETLLDAYSWALSVGWLEERHTLKGRLNLQEFNKILLKEALPSINVDNTEITDVFQKSLIGRRFLSTDQGYIGFGTNYCKPGKWTKSTQYTQHWTNNI